MKSCELISVIMSVYNESVSELEQAIESILSQSYKNFEFIIILDNPNNKVLKAKIENYMFKDSRIKFVINDKNIGLAKSLNRALSLCKGDFVARMDADDVSHKDRLKIQFEFIKKHKIDVLGTNRINIDDGGTVLGYKGIIPSKSKDIKEAMKISSVITHPSVMYKRDIILSAGGYRDFEVSQDYDLWLRLIQQEDIYFGNINKPLIKYRIREQSASQSKRFKQFLISKYQKELYFEREQKGFDSFSSENLNNFLEKEGINNVEKKDKFNANFLSYEKAIRLLKARKFLKGSFILIRVYIIDKNIRIIISNFIKYQRMKRKFT